MWFDSLAFMLRSPSAISRSLRHVVIHSQILLSFGPHWAGEHGVHVPRPHTCINHPRWGWLLLWLHMENPTGSSSPGWVSLNSAQFSPITSTAKKGKSVPGRDPEVLSELHPTHYPGEPLCLSPLAHGQYLGGGSSRIHVEHWVYCVPHSKLAS